jgi:hypothetical protein
VARRSVATRGRRRSRIRPRGARVPAPTRGRRRAWARAVVVAPAVAVDPIAAVIAPTTTLDHVTRLDVDVAAVGTHPVARHPVPVVAAPIPIAVDPDVAVSGRRRRVLSDWRRWRLVDVQLGLHLRLGLIRLLRVVDRLRRVGDATRQSPDHGGGAQQGKGASVHVSPPDDRVGSLQIDSVTSNTGCRFTALQRPIPTQCARFPRATAVSARLSVTRRRVKKDQLHDGEPPRPKTRKVSSEPGRT